MTEILFLCWLASAGLTWLIAVTVSFIMEGCMLRTTWVLLALGIMSVLGPVGTLMTAHFLVKMVVFTLRRTRRNSASGPAWRLRPTGS